MSESSENVLTTWLTSLGGRVRRRKDGSLHTIDFSPSPQAVNQDVIQQLGECRRLAVLLLPGAAVDDSAAPWLAQLEELTELDLRHTLLTDAGLPYLRSLRKLKLLQLTGASVTRDGVKALRQTLLNCRIVFFD